MRIAGRRLRTRSRRTVRRESPGRVDARPRLDPDVLQACLAGIARVRRRPMSRSAPFRLNAARKIWQQPGPGRMRRVAQRVSRRLAPGWPTQPPRPGQPDHLGEDLGGFGHVRPAGYGRAPGRTSPTAGRCAGHQPPTMSTLPSPRCTASSLAIATWAGSASRPTDAPARRDPLGQQTRGSRSGRSPGRSRSAQA